MNGPPPRSDAKITAAPSGIHIGEMFRPSGLVVSVRTAPAGRVDEDDLRGSAEPTAFGGNRASPSGDHRGDVNSVSSSATSVRD